MHGFCPKIELFLICLFHRNSIRKQRFWYCGKKRMILSGKNSSFKKGHKKQRFWYCGKKRMILSEKIQVLKRAIKNNVFDIVERKEWF